MNINTSTIYRASLVVQWLKICLPTHGTLVQSLVWGYPIRLKHCAPQPLSPRAAITEAQEPWSPSSAIRSHCSEQPVHGNQSSPCAAMRESPQAAMKTQHTQQQKQISNFFKLNLKKKKENPHQSQMAIQRLKDSILKWFRNTKSG